MQVGVRKRREIAVLRGRALFGELKAEPCKGTPRFHVHPLHVSETVEVAEIDEGVGVELVRRLAAIVDGGSKRVTPTAFGPAQTCTRGQIVTFLYRDLK